MTPVSSMTVQYVICDIFNIKYIFYCFMEVEIGQKTFTVYRHVHVIVTHLVNTQTKPYNLQFSETILVINVLPYTNQYAHIQ